MPRNFQTVRLLVGLLVLLAPGLQADDTPTPRQVYQQAVEAFAAGQNPTPDDLETLKALRARLVEVGEDELAANVDLLSLALGARLAPAADDEAAEAARLARVPVPRGLWTAVRNVGLVGTLVSAASLVAWGTAADWTSAFGHDSALAASVAVWSAVGVVGSLGPLLAGEAALAP